MIMAYSAFAEKVYSVCRNIPRGKVATYKEVSRALNIKGYRAVGQALRCSPGMPNVPCHRVVKSDGSIGGFKGKSAGKEIEEKIRLLEKERIKIKVNKVDLNEHGWKF